MSLHKIKASSTIFHSYVPKMSQADNQRGEARYISAGQPVCGRRNGTQPAPDADQWKTRSHNETWFWRARHNAEGFGHHALHGIRADIVYEACAFGVGLQHIDGFQQLEQTGFNQDRSGLAVPPLPVPAGAAVSISGGPTVFCKTRRGLPADDCAQYERSMRRALSGFAEGLIACCVPR